MKSIVAYCRSACEPQGGPSSVHGQARAIRHYATSRGWTVRATYTDAGVSGVTLDRPGLQDLLAACRAGKIGMVVTKDPERLSRDTSQLVALIHFFAKAGVRVEFSTPEGKNRLAFLNVYLSAMRETDEAVVGSSPDASKCQ